MERNRGADALAAALTAFGAVVLVSCGEYLAWTWSGKPSEWPPILDGTLALGAAAAVVAGLAALALPRFPATALGTLLGLALFGKNVLRVAGISGPAGWAGALVVAAAAAVGFAWIGGGRGRRAALLLVAVATLGVSWGTHAANGPDLPTAGRADLPNLILMVLDTTRQDRLSVYGYDKPTTPELVKFAERAQVYEQAWSVAPWTPPSHASMFTGLLPAEHGVDGQGTSPSFPPDLVTLPGVLAGSGYRTGGFPANVILTSPGWDRDFHVYQTASFAGRHSLIPWLNNLLRGWTEDDRDDYRTVHIFDRVKTWWTSNDGAPRFAFINLMDAHRKYRPLDEDFERFLPGVSREETTKIDAQFWKRFDPVHYRHNFTEREFDLMSRLYDAEIAGMDREMGRFFRWLEARGELDDTVIVITSDHGERLGERGVIGHKLTQDPYLLHIPLIVRYPAGLEPGRIQRRVQLDGLPGLFLHLAGLDGPEVMTRNSIHEQDRTFVVSQMLHPSGVLDDLVKHIPTFDPEPYRGDWFYVGDGDGFAYEWPVRDPPVDGTLTDIPADPQFTRDVSAQHPDRAAAMRGAADALPRYGDIAEFDASPEALEKLRALGYIR